MLITLKLIMYLWIKILGYVMNVMIIIYQNGKITFFCLSIKIHKILILVRNNLKFNDY